MIGVVNKKGVFFTLLAFVIIAIFVLSFSFISKIEERQSVEKRVESLNDFVLGLEEDIPRQLYTSGFRMIFLLENKIFEKGTYVPDLDASLQEAFFNGTIYGEEASLMSGATFSGIENSLRIKAAKVNANLSLENPVLAVYQESSWNIRVNLTADFFVEDVSGLASWNRTGTFSVLIPVSNFDDPLYIVNTDGLVTHKIVQTPYTTFVVGEDVSNLLGHLNGHYSIESASGPSFLDRLQGLTSGSGNGIESLVHLQELSGQGIIVEDKSVVDYIYFSSSNPSACNVVPAGMPSWFKLDSGHLFNYQVNCQEGG